MCFSDKSPVIIPSREPELWIPTLLAALATENYLSLIYAQSKFGSFETGSIKTLRVPDELLRLSVPDIMDRLFTAIDEIDARDETCQLFVAPPPANWDPISKLRSSLNELEEFLGERGYSLSRVVIDTTIDSARLRVEQLLSPSCRISYAIGVALGRWKGSVPTFLTLPGSLDALTSRAEAESIVEGPAAISNGSEWLLDDEGTMTDVVAAVSRVISQHGEHLGAANDQLRETMRTDTFALHLAQYSKSARKAPVYWQVASASARYSGWVFYHRLNKDFSLPASERLRGTEAAPRRKQGGVATEGVRSSTYRRSA